MNAATGIILAHADDLGLRSADDYLGSPMYAVIEEHQLAMTVGLFLVVAAGVVGRLARRGNPRAQRLLEPYERLTSLDRFLFWMTGLAGAIHLALLPGHELSWWSVGYAAIGIAELWVARRVLTQSIRRRLSIGIILAAILGWAATGLAGVVSDQLALATKLLEIASLAVLIQPQKSGRLRRIASSAAVIGVMLIVGLAAWVGAFAGDGGHHLGESAGPGTLIPRGEDRPPDEHERREADLLHQQTVAAVAKYQDPIVAAADGYDVENIFGLDYHAPNSEYQSDGRILDPTRPENLIYAVGPEGPVLVGVMYESEELGQPGPAVGGPLTVWHGHDHICFSLTPPALAGLTSPFGVCPAGALTLPITGEMLHVWTLPEAPDRFGHLEEDWLTAYLNGEPLPEPTVYESR